MNNQNKSIESKKTINPNTTPAQNQIVELGQATKATLGSGGNSTEKGGYPRGIKV